VEGFETADNRFELGTDTFIVPNGKIETQTFAGKISPMRVNARKNAALMRNQLTNDNEGEIHGQA
jgi:hypothetical protein